MTAGLVGQAIRQPGRGSTRWLGVLAAANTGVVDEGPQPPYPGQL